MDQKSGMKTTVYPSICNTFHPSEIQRWSQRRIWPIIWYEAHIKNIPQTCKLADNSIAEWSIILFKIWAKGRKHRKFSGTVRVASEGIIVIWCTSDGLLLTSECCICLAGHVYSEPCIHFLRRKWIAKGEFSGWSIFWNLFSSSFVTTDVCNFKTSLLSYLEGHLEIRVSANDKNIWNLTFFHVDSFIHTCIPEICFKHLLCARQCTRC